MLKRGPAAIEISMLTGAGAGAGQATRTRCPICFADPMQEPFQTPCGHRFCYTCLRTHLEQHRFCPEAQCGEFLTMQSIVPAFLTNTASRPSIPPGISPDTPRTPDTRPTVTDSTQPEERTPAIGTTTGTVNTMPAVAAGAGSDGTQSLAAESPAFGLASAHVGGDAEVTPNLTDALSSRLRTPPPITRSVGRTRGGERSPGSLRRTRAAMEATFNSSSASGAVITGAGGSGGGSASNTTLHAVTPQPATAKTSSSGLGADFVALLERDDMDPDQIGALIAALQAKKRAQGSSSKVMRDTLLHDFLRRARSERMTEIMRLQAEVAALDADLRTCRSDSNAMARVRGQQTFSSKSRRVDRIYDPLREHYFNSVPVSASVGGAQRSAALRAFSDDLLKVTRYGKLRERASLLHAARHAGAPSNIVSSIEFDRECRLVATAGVSKRIKLFEYQGAEAGEHYPVQELAARAKLSWVCWNPYVRTQIVSSDYEGVVALWDVSRNTPVAEFEEHEKRVWSVDFCTADPRVLASASDDGRVKIWTTAQPSSVITLGSGHANVCSVKFQPGSMYTLAYGSADHNVHLYDIRYANAPINVFSGHARTVSYVKFMARDELVSACVDSSIKLWSVSDMSLKRTYTGHTNDKNFVGLSVTNEMIACGSEENAIFVYYKAVPKPFAKFSFPKTDIITGAEVQEDDERFVSSVCWCPKDETVLVGANSIGAIKILRLVEDGEEDEQDHQRT